MRDVWILGTHSSAFARRPDSSFKDLTRETYLGVLADAGLGDGNDIATAWFGNCLMHTWGQGGIRGQVSTIELVDEGLFPKRVPIINVEGACATASMALHGAVKDIRSGDAEVSLAMGVEKTYRAGADQDPAVREQMFDAYRAGHRQLRRSPPRRRVREARRLRGLLVRTGTRPHDVHGHVRDPGRRPHGPSRHHAGPDRRGRGQEPHVRRRQPAGPVPVPHDRRRGARRPPGVLAAHPGDVRTDRRRRRLRHRVLVGLPGRPTRLGPGASRAGEGDACSPAGTTEPSTSRPCPEARGQAGVRDRGHRAGRHRRRRGPRRHQLLRGVPGGDARVLRAGRGRTVRRLRCHGAGRDDPDQHRRRARLEGSPGRGHRPVDDPRAGHPAAAAKQATARWRRQGSRCRRTAAG